MARPNLKIQKTPTKRKKNHLRKPLKRVWYSKPTKENSLNSISKQIDGN